MSPVRLVFLLIVTLMPASGQEYCSLIVRILGPVVAAPGVLVKVESEKGESFSARTENSVARFCGLGVLPVTVSVGNPADCNYTVVHNVLPTWGVAREIQVAFDQAACRDEGPAPILPCAILLRFTDEEGHPVGGVRLSSPVGRSAGPNSDAFGRAMIRLAIGEDLRTTAEKPGYRPEQVSLKCTNSLAGRERAITLRKLP